MRQVRIFLAGLTSATAITIILFLLSMGTIPNVPAQEGNPQTKKWQALEPVDEAAEPVDSHKRSLRQLKNCRHNSRRSDQILTELPPGVVSGRIDESKRPSSLPINESDAVILGTVIGVQPYLAEDKKSIYTEFTIRVEETFKSEVPAYMTAENRMVVDQEGGALRLKDGRILRYYVGGTSRLPSLNGRYVFFISLTHGAQDLAIVTGYELRNGSVISLEDGGDSSAYANWDEERFLGVLTKAVTHGFLSREITGGKK